MIIIKSENKSINICTHNTVKLDHGESGGEVANLSQRSTIVQEKTGERLKVEVNRKAIENGVMSRMHKTNRNNCAADSTRGTKYKYKLVSTASNN